MIGCKFGLPAQQLPAEAFGQLGPIFATDQPASSAITRAQLGWKPTHLSLLDDLEQNLTG